MADAADTTEAAFLAVRYHSDRNGPTTYGPVWIAPWPELDPIHQF